MDANLPAYRTAITTMTSFRHDGVYYIFGEKAALVLHRYDDDDDGYRLYS